MIKPDCVTKNDIICYMSEKLLRSTGKRIRALRDDRGWNQTDFVDILLGRRKPDWREGISHLTDHCRHQRIMSLLTKLTIDNAYNACYNVVNTDIHPQPLARAAIGKQKAGQRSER